MSAVMNNYYRSIQPNQGNFDFIGDEIEIHQNSSISGSWTAKSDYWFFADHWPDNPIVPAVIQLEVIFQNLALLFFANPRYQREDYILVTSIREAKFLRQITPGMKVYISGAIVRNSRGVAQLRGELHNDNSLVCSCNFDVYLEKEFNENCPKIPAK